MTVSMSIMHASFDPERRAMLHALLRSLGDSESYLAKSLVSYDVIADSRRAGPWPTAKRAWQSGVTSGATHHLVLQDDTIAVPGLLASLPAIVNAVPDQIISLWCNRPTVMRGAAMAGSCWIRGTSARGPALLMPTDVVDEFLRWQSRAIRAGAPDDVRVSLYAHAHKRHIWSTVPSLVEHIGKESTLGHPRGRWTHAGMLASDASRD